MTSKLYWAWIPDSPEWFGPHETESDCIAEAKYEIDETDRDPEIWIAPVDAALDDDDAFWDSLAMWVLFSLDDASERMTEEGWFDPEGDALPGNATDRNRILANALREVIGPRPDWRSVDTTQARRVAL